jgi:hypothetical protein
MAEILTFLPLITTTHQLVKLTYRQLRTWKEADPVIRSAEAELRAARLMLQSQIALMGEPWFEALTKMSLKSSPIVSTYEALSVHVKRIGSTNKRIADLVATMKGKTNFITRGISYDSHRKELKAEIDTLRNAMLMASTLSNSILLYVDYFSSETRADTEQASQ